jgi:hypothetical protein
MTKPFSSDYPVNTGKVLHGTLRVTGVFEKPDVDIYSVKWREHKAGALFTDITAVVKLCPAIMDELDMAAVNHCTPNEIEEDFTLSMQDQ